MQYPRNTRRPTPGHTGNRKNVIVEWRYSKNEIEEYKTAGIDLNPDWVEIKEPLTQKQATYCRVKYERMGFITRERNI